MQASKTIHVIISNFEGCWDESFCMFVDKINGSTNPEGIILTYIGELDHNVIFKPMPIGNNVCGVICSLRKRTQLILKHLQEGKDTEINLAT